MTEQRHWYGIDPLMAPLDRLPTGSRPLAVHGRDTSHAEVRPFGARLARTPIEANEAIPAQLGQHSKTYTFDKKTENAKVIVDGTEENHPDTTEVERETD
jgi:hypothetical protein